MSRRKGRRRTFGAVALVIAALAGWDFHAHRASIWFVGPAGAALGQGRAGPGRGPADHPANTLTLGEGHPTVAIAASIDTELPAPAPLDAALS